jgi:hypothetical protein
MTLNLGALRAALAAIGLAGFLIGLFFFWITWFEWRRRRRQSGWLPVPGTVRAVAVREVFQAEGSNDFRCDVLLRYDWQGQSFADGALVEGGERFLTRAEAEEFARGFPAGQAHTIFVNPANPVQAVARRADERRLPRQLRGWGLWLLFSGWLAYQGWDRLRW